jgi:hypothetical protein
MITNISDCTTLRNGVKMPWFGLGTWQTDDGNTVINSVKWAIKAGYRLIDTAAAYYNETGVGKAVREGTRIPSPGPTPNALRQRKMADVPEEVSTACFTPMNCANSFSKFLQ